MHYFCIIIHTHVCCEENASPPALSSNQRRQGLLQRVARHTLRGVSPLARSRNTAPPHGEEPKRWLRLLFQRLRWHVPWELFREAWMKTQEPLEGLCLSADLRMPLNLPSKTGGGVQAALKEVWAPPLRLRSLPPRSGLTERKPNWTLYTGEYLWFEMFCPRGS